MDNRQRAINYVRRKQLLKTEFVEPIVDHAMEPSVYEKVCLADLLTPAQLRRIKHKRAGLGAHRQAQRTRRKTALARRLEHLSRLYGG
jgi:hypothetical protein